MYVGKGLKYFYRGVSAFAERGVFYMICVRMCLYMGLNDSWNNVVKQVNRFLEKGIYIAMGLGSFFGTLICLFLFNCGFRFIESEFAVGVGVRCLLGESFPLWVFFVSLVIGLIGIVLTFYAVERQQRSD
jgi:hypothetical protein